jgi:hypothetical protein
LKIAYRLLADFVVLLHAAFVVFAVLGAFLVLNRHREGKKENLGKE